MAVSQATKDKLKARMPDVLDHYGVTNIRSNFCAFWRDDANPSATYYPDTYLVYDHGTGETFDVFALVGRIEGVEGFREQVERIASILGEQVEENPCSSRGVKRTSKRLLYEPPTCKGFDEDVRGACMASCRELLTATNSSAASHGRRWLKSRGFTDYKTWIQFGLGFVSNWCGKEIHQLLKTCENKGNVAGFVSIPYFDGKGEVHYCVLRTVVPAWCTDQEPNLKEWSPAEVGKPLYCEHYLRASMDTIAVTEGPIDSISLTIMTGTPTVGLGGTSNTKRFCQVLYYAKPEQRPKKVVLNLDANDPGRDASDKIAAFLDKIGVDHSVLRMPPGVKDANEWLQIQVKGEI